MFVCIKPTLANERGAPSLSSHSLPQASSPSSALSSLSSLSSRVSDLSLQPLFSDRFVVLLPRGMERGGRGQGTDTSPGTGASDMVWLLCARYSACLNCVACASNLRSLQSNYILHLPFSRHTVRAAKLCAQQSVRTYASTGKGCGEGCGHSVLSTNL